MKTHLLKIHPDGYARIACGEMTSQIRIADRPFLKFDRVKFYEWLPERKMFTGRTVVVEITDITSNCEGLDNQYCVLSIHFISTQWNSKACGSSEDLPLVETIE